MSALMYDAHAFQSHGVISHGRAMPASALPWATEANASSAPHCSFGPFRFYPTQRRVTKNGVDVPIGSRAFDILSLLVERAGHVVTKQELMNRAWPSLTVEESNLRVHIAGLRKALGDGQGGARYVANCTGRGYSLVAAVTRQELSKESPAPRTEANRASGAPVPITNIIGRDDDIRTISEVLLDRRFVTLRGPGGVGKTRVALAIAHQPNGFEDGVRFLDLGLLTSEESVVLALADALGIADESGDPTTRIVEFLRDRKMLVVLDCCEHVIDYVAALAELIFHSAPQVSILSTSREPLRASGEYVYTLPPLQLPPKDLAVSAEHLPNYSAARLFLERARASGHNCELSDTDAVIIADICRKVDGIALALELTAGRVSSLGLRGTAALLNSQTQLQWRGRRTAQPRHQTLLAMLDWSHDLISERERLILFRLSVLARPFTLDEALAAATDDSIADSEVVESVAQLVSKSLVHADTRKETTLYRLLGTTRAYVQVKLGHPCREVADV